MARVVSVRSKPDCSSFTIFPPTVPNILVNVCIDGPYVRDVSQKQTLSKQMLTCCSPICVTQTMRAERPAAQ